MAEYSYMVLYIARGTSRDAARRMLTDHAEYGHWELSRLRLYPDGSRKATLRRPIIRPTRSPLDGLPASATQSMFTSQARRAEPTGLKGGGRTFGASAADGPDWGLSRLAFSAAGGQRENWEPC
jgi:Family of unknown function (DUF5703)